LEQRLQTLRAACSDWLMVEKQSHDWLMVEEQSHDWLMVEH